MNAVAACSATAVSPVSKSGDCAGLKSRRGWSETNAGHECGHSLASSFAVVRELLVERYLCQVPAPGLLVSKQHTGLLSREVRVQVPGDPPLDSCPRLLVQIQSAYAP
jgi:hypothetical protein